MPAIGQRTAIVQSACGDDTNDTAAIVSAVTAFSTQLGSLTVVELKTLKTKITGAALAVALEALHTQQGEHEAHVKELESAFLARINASEKVSELLVAKVKLAEAGRERAQKQRQETIDSASHTLALLQQPRPVVVQPTYFTDMVCLAADLETASLHGTPIQAAFLDFEGIFTWCEYVTPPEGTSFDPEATFVHNIEGVADLVSRNALKSWGDACQRLTIACEEAFGTGTKVAVFFFCGKRMDFGSWERALTCKATL